MNDMYTLRKRDNETKTTQSIDGGTASSFRFIHQNPLEVGHVTAKPFCKYSSFSRFGKLRTHKTVQTLKYFLSRTIQKANPLIRKKRNSSKVHPITERSPDL